MARTNLVRLLLDFRDGLVDGLAAGVAFLKVMPMGDFFLAHLPAEQNRLAIDDAWKVEQAHVEIFYLNAGGVDFGDYIFDSLSSFFAFGSAHRDLADFNQQAAGKEYALCELLKLR